MFNKKPIAEGSFIWDEDHNAVFRIKQKGDFYVYKLYNDGTALIKKK